jgi:hypothetical protein
MCTNARFVPMGAVCTTALIACTVTSTAVDMLYSFLWFLSTTLWVDCQSPFVIFFLLLCDFYRKLKMSEDDELLPPNIPCSRPGMCSARLGSRLPPAADVNRSAERRFKLP